MAIKEITIPTLKTKSVFRAITTQKVSVDLAQLVSQIDPGTRIVLEMEEDFVKESGNNGSPILENFGQASFFTYDIPYYADFSANINGTRVRTLQSTSIEAQGSLGVTPNALKGLFQDELSSTSSMVANGTKLFDFDYTTSRNVLMCSDNYYIYRDPNNNNNIIIKNINTGGTNSLTQDGTSDYPYSHNGSLGNIDMNDSIFAFGIPNFSGRVNIHNTTNGNLIRTLTGGSSRFGESLAINSNNDIAVGASGACYVYNSSGTLIRTITPPSGYTNLGFQVAINDTYVGVTGGYTANGQNYYDALIYNISTGALLKTIAHPTGYGFPNNVTVPSIQMNDDRVALMYYTLSNPNQFSETIFVTDLASTSSYTISDPNTADSRDLGPAWKINNTYVAVGYQLQTFEQTIRFYNQSNGSLATVLTESVAGIDQITNTQTSETMKLIDMSEDAILIQAIVDPNTITDQDYAGIAEF